MTHFQNEKRNISNEMPTAARELVGFFALVVDITSQKQHTKLTPSTLRCFKRRCNGQVQTDLTPNQKEIH